MIQGYPDRPSVVPGGTLALHVSTDVDRFRVDFYRRAESLVRVASSGWLPGKHVAAGDCGGDWNWPRYELAVPETWPSGAYIARFVERPGSGGEAPGPPTDTRSGAALFVVRTRRPGRSAAILYKLPLATYHAYNLTGGSCFYQDPVPAPDPPGSIVTLHRPGGGIGGAVHGHPDEDDPGSPRQTFAHWDARFIGWLATNGYAVDFCTDLDVHEDPELLAPYHALLSVGHDEYWSAAMRAHVEAFIEAGGNVGFFSGNTCWWRIHFVANHTAIVCNQRGPAGTAADQWWPATGANDPEDSLTGVSYRNGGGWWEGRRQASGYVVQQAGHWVFAGTGLRDGASFGTETRPPLAGYECDGIRLSHVDPHGFAVPDPKTYRYGTPRDFQVLGVSVLGDGWADLPPREDHRPGEGIHAATMGLFTRNGTVFTAGTTDWAQVLGSGQDHRVDRITRNVLDRLGRGGAGD